MVNPRKPNHLAGSASPYLLQHAYNPVDWYPWGLTALDSAVREDKPILVSIGYSSCHWCHVMERESFESEEIAAIMNSRFICIKVDREERPDIDQVYLDAVQAMGIHGGWPLNVFLTPDQKPFYGGTYFRPAAWKQILVNVSDTYRNSRPEVKESAEKLSRYIARSEMEQFGLEADHGGLKAEELSGPVQKLVTRFDPLNGGMTGAPKFPMPALWNFLLRYAAKNKDTGISDHVHFTLRKMAGGGIYDQVGGGFARYSVDERWFAPHFEKMLYDNAQLLSLFSDACRLEPDLVYQRIILQTVDFLKRELMDSRGGFYSALDADSEGEEGKYYTWDELEIDALLGDDSALLKEYWQVTRAGNWEAYRNILHVADDPGFYRTHSILPDEMALLARKSSGILLKEREKRIRPALDHKIIVAWNGLLIKGLVDAWMALKEPGFLDLAVDTAEFIFSLSGEEGDLPRIAGSSNIPGYLDDYAFMAEACLSLYHALFDEKWITRASALADFTIRNFYDPSEEMFFYTASPASLIARKKEIFDNVIPGSNSVMAMNLFRLGIILGREDYSALARNMGSQVKKLVISEPEYLYRWLDLLFCLSSPIAEIAVIGPDYKKVGTELSDYFNPSKLVLATGSKSDLPLFKERVAINGQTTIYVCYNKSCRLPVHTVEEAKKLIG